MSTVVPAAAGIVITVTEDIATICALIADAIIPARFADLFGVI